MDFKTHEAFRKAIAEKPWDTLPRKLYMDWLLDHGCIRAFERQKLYCDFLTDIKEVYKTDSQSCYILYTYPYLSYILVGKKDIRYTTKKGGTRLSQFHNKYKDRVNEYIDKHCTKIEKLFEEPKEKVEKTS